MTVIEMMEDIAEKEKEESNKKAQEDLANHVK